MPTPVKKNIPALLLEIKLGGGKRASGASSNLCPECKIPLRIITEGSKQTVQLAWCGKCGRQWDAALAKRQLRQTKQPDPDKEVILENARYVTEPGITTCRKCGGTIMTTTDKKTGTVVAAECKTCLNKLITQTDENQQKKTHKPRIKPRETDVDDKTKGGTPSA